MLCTNKQVKEHLNKNPSGLYPAEGFLGGDVSRSYVVIQIPRLYTIQSEADVASIKIPGTQSASLIELYCFGNVCNIPSYINTPLIIVNKQNSLRL